MSADRGNYTRNRSGSLRRANLELEKLHYLVRLASDLHFLNRRRYQHAAERIDEIGRPVGGQALSRSLASNGMRHVEKRATYSSPKQSGTGSPKKLTTLW